MEFIRILYRSLSCFFFFQAEDGIRDLIVTGVQTCALPICNSAAAASAPPGSVFASFCASIPRTSMHPTRCSTWGRRGGARAPTRPLPCINRRSEEHTSELQSRSDLVCRLLLEKKKIKTDEYRPELPARSELVSLPLNQSNTPPPAHRARARMSALTSLRRPASLGRS